MNRSPNHLLMQLFLVGSLIAGCEGTDGDSSESDTGTTAIVTTGGPTGEDTTSDETTSDTQDSTTDDPVPGCATPAGTSVTLAGQPVPVTLDPGGRCDLELALDAPRIVAVHAAAVELLSVGQTQQSEPGWVRPTYLPAGSHPLVLEHLGPEPLQTQVTLTDFGPAVNTVERERSLVWTGPALTEGPQRCGLQCVLANISEDGHGGRLLAHWFQRFGTTAHSERLGPSQMLAAFSEQLGPDPSTWNLDALPFVVTAIHNRIDLQNGEHCGEFRISMASTDPIYRPFHLIFLFRQPPGPEDLSPAGNAHCTATGLRWARLSTLDEETFVAEAEQMIAQRVHATGFVAAESLEFMISPWEWRQWFFEVNPNPEPGLSQVLENRPLFQTLDIPRLNQPGPERDEFLQWVGQNAEALDARELLLPEAYRSASARLNQGVPWVPLSLDGVEPSVLEAYPNLRQNLEIVGCPACHATDAEFVQTLPDRTFSDFYDKELDAREVFLKGFVHGMVGEPPHGPLQTEPVLPP